MGNLEADDNGTAEYDRTIDGLTLSGADSIVGKSVLVHSQEDDLESQPTGDAGARLACGVIQMEGAGTGMGTTPPQQTAPTPQPCSNNPSLGPLGMRSGSVCCRASCFLSGRREVNQPCGLRRLDLFDKLLGLKTSVVQAASYPLLPTRNHRLRGNVEQENLTRSTVLN